MGEMRQITVDGDTADAIARAVADCAFPGEAEMVAEAMTIWREVRLTELRALIDEALVDDQWVEGNFDAEDIKRRGRERLGLSN